MIRIHGMVFSAVLFFTALSFTPLGTIPLANAGLFGSIESVDVLKEVAANQAKKKDNRAIASDTTTTETTVEGDTGPSATTSKKSATAVEPGSLHKQ